MTHTYATAALFKHSFAAEIDFSLDGIEDRRPEGSASGAAIRERNQ